jgi:FkbM family methyltransferase
MSGNSGLKKAFQRLNEGAQGNVLIFRERLNFVIHPDSREPFEMFCYRSSEMVEEMDAFLALTKSKNRLLDVGALHGVFSLAFAAMNSARKVVAVEPSPIAFSKLLYNVRKNDLAANIVMQESALSDTSGNLQMYYEWEHAVAAPLAEPGRMFSVEKILGDVLCEKLAFKPDVIKIDVEGHELKVIKGLAQTIKSAKPLLFLEVHPERITRENDNISDLSAFFEDAGYRGKRCNGEPIELRELVDLHADARIIFEPGREQRSTTSQSSSQPSSSW